MLLGIKKSKIKKDQGCIRILLFIALILGCISGVMANQEIDTGWNWSVETKDIQGQTPSFYIPTDNISVTWYIKPAADANIKDAHLRIYYPMDSDISKYKIYSIPPTEGYNYINGTYQSNKTILLDQNTYSMKDPMERTYNVEIKATAITESKQVNETHIIEIKIKETGALEIQKTIPGWAGANLSGWIFTLIDDKGTPIRRDSTDSSGTIIFAGLRPGNYTVREDSRSGWSEIGPQQVEVKPGAKLPPLVIPNTPNTLKISKIDSEGNSLSGWMFKANGPNGTVFIEPTDNSGIATIKGLPSGIYYIQEEPKDGWKLISIDPNPVTFGSGENKSVRITNARTGNLRFIKKDSEGQPLSGWSFAIEGPERVITNRTDNSGVVVAKNLMPGEYIVEEIIPEDLKGQWRPKTELRQKVTLHPGETATVQYINDHLLTLRIIKFDDENKNGLPGWMFTVEGPEGTRRVGPTNPYGILDVNNLVPGKHVVTEEIPQDTKSGWICTTPNPQFVQISSKLPNEVEFGNKVNRLIITKFNDTNLNGGLDRAEEGLKGWNFTLIGPNGLMKTPEPTNATGISVLENLMPGNYLITEIPQRNWINTTPSNRSVSIKAGVEQKVAFGNINSNVIDILKFNDTNRNGIIDSGESGLSGWIFTIEDSNGHVFTTKPTNADGITILEGLFPGNYTVTEKLLEGWLSTTPPVMNISLGFGNHQMLTFGNYYCVRCHRISDNLKTDTRSDPELTIIKEVSNISAEKIDKDNGYVVNYNITLCPSRNLTNIAAIPTDIMIALDNSPSITNLNRSAIAGVQMLVEGIKAHDKLNVTRVGLVSWSDKNNSKIEVPLKNDYNSIITIASNIRFAEGKQTDYQVGLDTSLGAFKKAGSIDGRDKKIVIITDANDSGYQESANIRDARYSDYAIFAVIVGDQKGRNATKMLEALTREHHGYVISINDLSRLGEVLTKIATTGSRLRNVHLVEVLPNYLVLLNNTATDDNGKVRLNGGSRDWTTTTITWDIDNLSACWSTDFQAVFCWKLPADVNQPRQVSFVNYTEGSDTNKSLELPEHEIYIVPALSRKQQDVPTNTEGKRQPGFEVLFAAIGLYIAGCLYRRKGW